MSKSLWRAEFADNGWIDWYCPYCGPVVNADNHVNIDYLFCPRCGSRMTDEIKHWTKPTWDDFYYEVAYWPEEARIEDEHYPYSGRKMPKRVLRKIKRINKTRGVFAPLRIIRKINKYVRVPHKLRRAVERFEPRFRWFKHDICAYKATALYNKSRSGKL